MPLRFLRFFSANTSADGLRQTQREAIADLLHFIVYADNHVALPEGEFVHDAIDGLAWDASLSFSAYETRSIADARRARENAAGRHEFLASIATRLDSAEARSRALTLAQGLIQADGQTTTGESALLSELQALLGA